MDLSKLPKLSQTPAPPDNAAGPDPAMSSNAAPGANSTAPKVELYCRCGAPITPGTNFCSHCGANYYEAVGGRGNSRPRDADAGPSGGMWIEAFFSIAVGLFLIMIASDGIKYLAASISGKPFAPYLHPSEPGQCVDYLRFQDTTTGAITDYRYRDMFDKYWSDMAVEEVLCHVSRNHGFVTFKQIEIPSAHLRRDFEADTMRSLAAPARAAGAAQFLLQRLQRGL